MIFSFVSFSLNLAILIKELCGHCYCIAMHGLTKIVILKNLSKLAKPRKQPRPKSGWAFPVRVMVWAGCAAVVAGRGQSRESRVAESRAPTIPKPRRRPTQFAVSMATSSNDVSIPRGGGGARGVAPLHPPPPLHPCHCHSTVGPCKMTDVNFGYTSLEGNDIFIKMKMR